MNHIRPLYFALSLVSSMVLITVAAVAGPPKNHTPSDTINTQRQITLSCKFNFLPFVVNNASFLGPTPQPTPLPIFRPRPDACYSPNGSVDPTCKIYSTDRMLYVMQTSTSASEFGIFDACNNVQLNTFTGDLNNNLKGMAFSPNSNQVALMYHYASVTGNQVRFVDDLLGTLTKSSLAIGAVNYHYMVYLSDNCLGFSFSGSESDLFTKCP